MRTNGSNIPLKLNVGDVILNLYEVKQIHQAGGMGLVYRVYHKTQNVEMALKISRSDIFRSEGQKKRFAQEFLAWINLDLHPNIVRCYYVRPLRDGIPAIFAEYIHGGSLKDWIDSRKLYEDGPDESLKRMLDIAIQCACGLGYAHEKGLVHLDVKPGNVMITQDGVAKITDFGLAKARAIEDKMLRLLPQYRNLATSGVMTPAYCSPEQANKEHLSYKSDIWSLGLSILEMFAGDVTWMTGIAATGALESYLEEEINYEYIPLMPKSLADLLRQCFQEDPNDRPSNMKEIAEGLKAIYQNVVGDLYFRKELHPFEALQKEVLNLHRRIRMAMRINKEMPSGRLDQEVNLLLLGQILRETPSRVLSAFFLSLCNVMSNYREDDVYIMENLWVIVALVLEFGELSPLSLKVREKIPKYFEESIEMIKTQSLVE